MKKGINIVNGHKVHHHTNVGNCNCNILARIFDFRYGCRVETFEDFLIHVREERRIASIVK